MKHLLFLFFIIPVTYSFGQSGSEIFLFDMNTSNGQIVLSNPVNITLHPGYDNQPFFHPSQPLIYYSSFNDSGRSDIKYYDYSTGMTYNLTQTHDKEYSPTVTPDLKHISCIIQRDDGRQDLGEYPLKGGDADVLINNLKIGYHAWADRNKLLLFVLGDSDQNTLHYYNLDSRADTIIAWNIGRSLHQIPGQQAMSFVQKVPGQEGLIKKFDVTTGAISTIATAIHGQDHLTWLQNSIILMSDGTNLFSYQAGVDADWKAVIIKGDTSFMKGVTRLATDTKNKKLAVVVSE